MRGEIIIVIIIINDAGQSLRNAAFPLYATFGPFAQRLGALGLRAGVIAR